MKLKKIAALVMAAALAVSMFTSCGWDEDEENASSSGSSSSSSSTNNGSASGTGSSSSSSSSSSTVPAIGDDTLVLNELINGIIKELKPQIDAMMAQIKTLEEKGWESLKLGLKDIGFDESEAASIVAVMQKEDFQIDANTTISTRLNSAVRAAATILDNQAIDDIDVASNRAMMIVWGVADSTKYFPNGLGAFVMTKSQLESVKEELGKQLAESLVIYKAVEAGVAGTSNPYEFIYEMGLASFTSADGTEYYVVGIGVKPGEKTQG